MNVQKETLGATRTQQWNMASRPKEAAMSKKQDVQQNFHKGSHGDCEAKSQIFSQY
jgi:hypothetical protein